MSLLTRLLTAAFTALAFMAMLYSLWLVGPYLERWLAGPVVTKLQIVRIEPTADRHSIIHVLFTKRRLCEFVGLSWYYAQSTEPLTRVPVILKQPGDISNQTRPLGRQLGGPWEVFMPPDDLQNRSFAKVHHRCHGLWTTVTDFYP